MMTAEKDGMRYLELVTEKLRVRMDELKQTLREGQKDIESMHEYYWENYTEMDQYGYEDFDNQQALLHQVSTNQANLRLLHRLERMTDTPFFGRVDFVYEGEEQPEQFYIGIGNFSERPGALPMIYDWRAPVSGLFYDFDRGPAFYEAPCGCLEGEISAKWQYKIRGGHMIYGFESDVKIDDEILKQELGSSGDVQLKNIVRTIQKEQNAIIRNTGDRILVIQGAAGSGKTSIALHRIAYLLYHDREHLQSSNVLVLSPNSVFSDYISHILPELGEENIREMTFDLFAYHELKEIAADCEDRYDWLERKMKEVDEKETERFRWKQSEGFVGQTEGFLAQLEDRLVEFLPVSFRGMEMTEQELIQLFYFRFQEIPLLSRMDAVKDYFIDAWETLHGRDLSEEERMTVQNKFDRMYVTKDIYEIYRWLLEECALPILPDLPYEKRFLAYEDVFPILYLKYRLSGKKEQSRIRHLVIDEMQDYSYLQYVILSQLFSCRMTILGDRAQTMDEQYQDVLAFLPKIFGHNLKKIVLNKSYRNTLEIAQYAATLTGVTGLELMKRHGKEVVEIQAVDLAEAVSDLVRVRKEDAHCQMEEEYSGYETESVLVQTMEEAERVLLLLEEHGVKAKRIDRDSSSFPKGLVVTTFYLAKGLEFDRVFGITVNDDSAFLQQVRYICATRALHELRMYRYGRTADDSADQEEGQEEIV